MPAVTLKGEDELKKMLAKSPVQIRNNVTQALNKGALLVQNAAIKEIQQGTKSGEIYLKTKQKIEHTSSKAGEAPATDTGNLAGGIHVIEVKNRIDPEARVESRAKYSKALEFGTKNMDARPFLKPALDKNIKKIVSRVHSALKKGLKDGSKS